MLLFHCSCDKSIYHALGIGTFQYLQAVMTFEQVSEEFYLLFKIREVKISHNPSLVKDKRSS